MISPYTLSNGVIIRNLALCSFIVSVFAGLLVFLVEYQRIEGLVAKLAHKESLTHADYYSDYYSNPSNVTRSKLRGEVKKQLSHDSFVLIELYDVNLNKIISESLVQEGQVVDGINAIFPDFPMGGEFSYFRKSLAGKIYIKVMLPIRRGAQDNVIGHFEGIYHLSNNDMDEITTRITLSIIQSLITVLVVTLLLYPIIVKLKGRLTKRSNELLKSNIQTIKSLGSAIAKRDSDTNAHNYRVAIYSVRLAEKLGAKDSQIRALIKGAFLHDIGKIGISDAILQKPGKLSSKEFNTMKEHVRLGIDIIENNEWLSDAKDVVLYHHEKFDGTGYPEGLIGSNIPSNARIFALSDVFDALTSIRPYKDGFSLDKSLGILKEGSGSYFDPRFLNVFVCIAHQLYDDVGSLLDDDILGVHLDSYIDKYFSHL